jgi:hypothetical protein
VAVDMSLPTLGRCEPSTPKMLCGKLTEFAKPV